MEIRAESPDLNQLTIHIMRCQRFWIILFDVDLFQYVINESS